MNQELLEVILVLTWGDIVGGVSKALKKVTSWATGGLLGGRSSGGGGTQEVTIQASAASPTDITGNQSGSEESMEKAQAKKKAGKRSLSVNTGENSGGSTRGLNVV